MEPWDDLAVPNVFVDDGRHIMLVGVSCASCGRIDFPATPFCRYCLSEAVERYEFDGTGELYAFTTIHTADPAYTVGYIDIPNGLRVFAHLTGEVAISDRVTVISTELPVTYAREGTSR